jgi:hypothetical protein
MGYIKYSIITAGVLAVSAFIYFAYKNRHKLLAIEVLDYYSSLNRGKSNDDIYEICLNAILHMKGKYPFHSTRFLTDVMFELYYLTEKKNEDAMQA